MDIDFPTELAVSILIMAVQLGLEFAGKLVADDPGPDQTGLDRQTAAFGFYPFYAGRLGSVPHGPLAVECLG